MRHELRNMFAGILGSVQLIVRDSEADDGTTRSRLDAIHVAATRSLDILERMELDPGS